MSVQNLKTENWIAAMLRVAARFGKPADGKTLRQQMRWFEHLPAEQQLERLCGLLGLHLTMVSPTNCAGARTSRLSCWLWKTIAWRCWKALMGRKRTLLAQRRR